MTHRLFFSRCVKRPLISLGAACALLAISKSLDGRTPIPVDSVGLAGLWLIFSLAVAMEFFAIPKRERNTHLCRSWTYLWLFLWNVGLLPGITLCAITRFASYYGKRLILRRRMWKLREAQQAALPFIPTPPWLLARYTQNGRTGYRKPETVLETSSVACADDLDARELERRNKILETDEKIRHLRLEQEEIQKRWTFLLSMGGEALENCQQRLENVVRSLSEIAVEANVLLFQRRDAEDQAVYGDLEVIGNRIAHAQQRLAQARHAYHRSTAETLLHTTIGDASCADAFEKLWAFPNVLAVDADVERQTISVYTDTLYISVLTGWRELGNFRIDYKRDSYFRYVQVVNLASTHPCGNYTPYSGYSRCHCFGDLRSDIYELLQVGEIHGAMVHILKSLTHLNHGHHAIGFKFMVNGEI